MALLGYSSGLRVSEIMGLRIKDVDFHTRRIIVRQGKGGKDRVTPLPQTAFAFLKDQIQKSRMLYDLDRRNGVPGVALPGALERKYPRAGTEWGWHFVFAARELSTDPRSGTVRRHHIHEAFFQRAVKEAARQARIARSVTPHTLRHSAVYPPRRTTHMLERGADKCHPSPRSECPSGYPAIAGQAVSRRLRRSAERCRNSSGTRTCPRR